MQPVYRTVFGKAWDMLMHHKILWLLGLFSSLIISDGQLSIIVRAFDAASLQQAGLQNLRSLYEKGFFDNLRENMLYFFILEPTSVSFYAALTLFFILAITIIVILAQSALIYSVIVLERKKKVSFKESIQSALGVFWKIFSVQLLSKLAAYLIVISISAPFIIWLLDPSSSTVLPTFVLFFVIVPLTIIISFITKYAMVSLISRGRGVIDALYEGWKVFLNNWFISLEMAAILLFIHLVAVFVLVVLAGLGSLPFILLMLLSLFLGAKGIALIFLICVGALLLFLLLLFSGGLSAFQFASWALLFSMLTKGKAVAKLERILGTGVAPKLSFRKK